MKKTILYTNKQNQKTYQVVITYKHIRNIIYRFKDGSFYVSAPILTTQKNILEHLDIFYPKLTKEKKKKPNPIDDNSIMILGSKIFKNDCNLFIFSDEKHFKNELKKYAYQVFDEELRKYEKIMNIAKHYNLRIREMSTRYGSNSRYTYSITLQLGLIHYSRDIIDSVIIHELCHYFVFNHSDDFYKILYKYCPNYKIYRKKLRNGEFK